MKKRVVPLPPPFAYVVLLLLAGCATLGRQALRSPEVQLKDIKVRGIGLQGGSLDLMLDVYNPNDFRIDVTRLTYNFFTDTATVAAATGDIARRVTLDSKKHNEVALPVSFNVNQLNGAFRVLMQKGSVDYKINGQVTLDTPFGSLTRPYEGKARFDNGLLIPR